MSTIPTLKIIEVLLNIELSPQANIYGWDVELALEDIRKMPGMTEDKIAQVLSQSWLRVSSASWINMLLLSSPKQDKF